MITINNLDISLFLFFLSLVLSLSLSRLTIECYE